DPVQIAWAAWEASGALKDLGNPEEGLMHCQDALAVLTPLIGQSPSDEQLSVFVELYGQAALLAAHCSDDGAALRCWERGAEACSRSSPGYRNPVTAFGREGSGVILVWINAALGKHAATIQAADRINVADTPSRPLQALWLVNVAKGYAGRRDD